MTDEKTGKSVGTEAARVLGGENPFLDDRKLELITTKLVDRGWNTNRALPHAVADLKSVLNTEFASVFAELRSLAGSALTQRPDRD